MYCDSMCELIDKLSLQQGIVENMPGPVEKGILTSYEDGSTDIDYQSSDTWQI